jgi:hypothetical protein
MNCGSLRTAVPKAAGTKGTRVNRLCRNRKINEALLSGLDLKDFRLATSAFSGGNYNKKTDARNTSL